MHGWRLGEGHHVFAMSSSAPVGSSAARAAHRDARPLPHLFRASYSCSFGARTLGAWLAIAEEQMITYRYRMEQTRGGARQCHRSDWPETDVGAALRRDAPRGRRSISQALKML